MTKEEKVARFQKMNQDIRKGQILCAGSSLMEMFPVEKFVKEEYPGTIIYNRGIGGYITDELLEPLDVCVLDLQPSRLFINIGTNDLSNPDVTIDGLMKKYDEILCRIEKAIPDIEIYLMAYFPKMCIRDSRRVGAGIVMYGTGNRYCGIFHRWV